MEDTVMRACSNLAFLLLVTLVGATIGCSKPTYPTGHPPKTVDTGTVTVSGEVSNVPDNPIAPIGTPLYKPADAPKFPATPMMGADPIVIPNCVVNYEERQIISSEVEASIDLIATPMVKRPDGIYEYRDPVDKDKVLATHDPSKFDPKNLHPRIVFNPREKQLLKDNPAKWVPYYQVREGENVVADQLLCMLDDSLVLTKKDSAAKIKLASAEGLKYAKEGVKHTEDKIGLYKELILKGSTVISRADYLNDLVTLSRFQENLAQAAQAIAKAEADYDEAEVMLRKYYITTRVRGIIRSVPKRNGEFVRTGDKLFEIQSTERVRLEGSMDVQYFDRVKTNMEVTVEPALASTPVKSHAWHRQEVTGVAVTGLPNRPLIVSTSHDGSALVWDPNLANNSNQAGPPHNLPHPVAVRCVACTPPNTGAVLAVTGADDGKMRVWDLADPSKLPNTPLREPTDAHASGIHAIAISPDGKFAATAAGREVFVWDLAAGKKLYALPEVHRDTITSLSFTPQAQLVTASKDRTLKVWRLGEEKGAPARTIDHRSGTVDALGVSPDGGRVLFDQDKSRIDLVDLSNGQTTGQLTNAGPNVAFATLAIFAPDRSQPGTPVDQLPPYVIATAGGDGDLKGTLQVWRVARSGGRGGELGRLVTPGRVAVTCAAFSPNKDAPFLVAGTAAGTVHVWTPPSGTAKRIEGRISYIDATDPRYVSVRVEMSNKELGLLDRSAATVIVNPGQ
jgi:WD40 repeat protein